VGQKSKYISKRQESTSQKSLKEDIGRENARDHKRCKPKKQIYKNADDLIIHRQELASKSKDS